MRITLHMASRGRPLRLIAALMSLRDNESGKHEVRYAVACDTDDPATIGTCQSLQAKLPLGYRVGHRPVSMDSLHNQLALDVPADVYVCFIDDALCLTKDWDDKIAETYEANPKGLWFWKSKGDDLTLIPIMSEAYRAAAGRIFPEHFPYWWGDTWLSEVWVLATEGPLMFAPVELIDCPIKTHGMRDLRFWHDFYRWLQPERIAEAKKIAEKLGLKPMTVTDHLSRFTNCPSRDFVARIEQIEQGQGETTPPHAGYLEAKRRAEAMLGGPPPPASTEISIEDLLTPEVIAVLNQHFPECAPNV